MKTPTKNEELNQFAEILNQNGWTIIVPETPSTYLHAVKDSIFLYIQKEYFSGFSFSTENKPSKKNGAGARALSNVELTLENLEKAIIFYNNYKGYTSEPVLKYKSIEDYFKTATNRMLGNHVYEFNK